jgi:hypothetical protein
MTTVGFTNRKAKRARGKMARRQRLADRGAAIGEANRREDAKRYAAGEVHRLQMKGGGERLAALVRDIIDGSEGEPMPDTIALPNTPAGRAAADAISALNERHRAFVDAQSAALASSISPSETRIAGRSPGPIPRPGQATPDGTARIESVTFTADTQHGPTSVVTKTRPIMSHDIVGQRVDVSYGYGSPSPTRVGFGSPMSATLAATEEPAMITRNVAGSAWVPGSLVYEMHDYTAAPQPRLVLSPEATAALAEPVAFTTTITADAQAHGGVLPLAVTHFRRSLGPVDE